MNPPVTQEQINNEGMSLTDLSKQMANQETPQQTLDRAKRMVEPTISANDLAEPVQAPQLTMPEQEGIPGRLGTMVGNTKNSIRTTIDDAKRAQEDAALLGDLGTIRSQSETAQEVDRLRGDYQQFAQDSNITDLRQNALLEFGVTPEALQELQEIDDQLAINQGESDLTKTRIAGAAGQTMGQGRRELTQEDREEAVRSATLASRANVLRGNINLGRQLANDAVNIAMQDRTFQANAKIMQINQLQSQVDEETSQLLEAEKRQYEAELANIEELKTNISAAITSGASQEEIATMNDPNTPDADKLALSRQVIARNASEQIGLDREAQRASIRSSNASARSSEATAALKEKELDLLNNPVLSASDQFEAETVELLNDLDGSTKTAIVDSRDTVKEIEAMKSLISSVDNNMELLVPGTEAGREFRRLAENVADKLARERTGAVVSEEEQKSFRKIMGLGAFNVLVKDDEEVMKGLNSILSPHVDTLNINDPQGRVRQYLDAQALDAETSNEIDILWGVPETTNNNTDINPAKYF